MCLLNSNSEMPLVVTFLQEVIKSLLLLFVWESKFIIPSLGTGNVCKWCYRRFYILMAIEVLEHWLKKKKLFKASCSQLRTDVFGLEHALPNCNLHTERHPIIQSKCNCWIILLYLSSVIISRIIPDSQESHYSHSLHYTVKWSNVLCYSTLKEFILVQLGSWVLEYISEMQLSESWIITILLYLGFSLW